MSDKQREQAVETEADVVQPDAESAVAEEAAVDAVEEGDPTQQLTELQQQADEYKDQFLRAKAEAENIRRRSDKQLADSRKYAVEGFARELITVRDSLQLAADVELEAGDSDAVKSMHEGLVLTLKQLDGVFEKFSIEQIAPEAGEKPDPNLHQAMSMQPSEDVAPGCIISVLQQGYKLHDRLLRPAMVIVAKK